MSLRACTKSRSGAKVRSLQLGIIHLGLLQNGNVRVGVFPEREEIIVGSLRFGGVALHGLGAGELQMSESAEWEVYCDSSVV
jgi:hypothetical protein